MSQCRTVFKTSHMQKIVRCELEEDHKPRYHQHTFRTWVVRVWINGTSGMRFSYKAKPGQVLPQYLDPPWTKLAR